jgi:hypothetical protein
MFFTASAVLLYVGSSRTVEHDGSDPLLTNSVKRDCIASNRAVRTVHDRSDASLPYSVCAKSGSLRKVIEEKHLNCARGVPIIRERELQVVDHRASSEIRTIQVESKGTNYRVTAA